MDINNIRDQVSNLTLYDLKAGVRKVQNAVMNYTEMESKVREATNNEPWGASSTLMQEIANGTHSYQLLNEIMPMIYKRFTDKTAEEWRQIYKSLQLLEFLVKNGSERVIDDARSHLSLLRMLRQFHYIDQNGKDQGINVRNRAQELAKLLGDVEAIRAERKKARANRNKFGGIEGGMKIGGFSGGSGMGGFGSEDTFGGYSGRVYGDGGGFGGNTNSFQDSGRRGNRFEEYDEYNEGTSSSSSRRKTTDPSPGRVRRETKKPEPPKQPEPDLFDFGEDDEPATTSSSQAAGKKPADSGLDMLSPDPVDDDEFDDFQSATPANDTAAASNVSAIPPPTSTSTFTTTSSTQFAAPQPVSGTQGANLNDLVGFSSMTSASSTPSNVVSPMSPPASTTSSALPQTQIQQPMKPTGYQASQPNYYTSVPAPQGQAAASTTNAAKPQSTALGSSAATSGRSTSISSAPKKSSGGDAFGSLWSTASAGAGIQKSNSTAKQGPNLASMAKEKASAGIWGAPAASGTSTMAQPSSSQSTASGQKSGGAVDDLLG